MDQSSGREDGENYETEDDDEEYDTEEEESAGEGEGDTGNVGGALDEETGNVY